LISLLVEKIDCFSSAKAIREFRLTGGDFVDLHCLESAEALEELEIDHNPSLRDLSALDDKVNLKQLTLKRLPQVTRVDMPALESLQHLEIHICMGLSTLKGHVPELQTLSLGRCEKLKLIDLSSVQSKLEKVRISASEQLVEINCLSSAKAIREFRLTGSGLVDLHCLESAEALEILRINGSPLLRDLSALEDKVNLKQLELLKLPQVTRLDLSAFESLEQLHFLRLTSLDHLEGVSDLINLKQMRIEVASKLVLSHKLEELPVLRRATVDKSCFSKTNLESLRRAKNVRFQRYPGETLQFLVD